MSEPVRLLTVNLLHDGATKDQLIRLLDTTSPDVVVAQELNHKCAEVIDDRFSHTHLDPQDDFTGRGIGTNLDARFGDVPMPARHASTAALQVGGDVWNLAGVHLVNPIKFPWWRSVRSRTGQVEAVIEWSAQLTDDPLLVVGDFNASPRWPAYRRLRDRWIDLVEEHAVETGVDLMPTWGWRPGWKKMLRIDHVFGSGLTAVDVSVHQVRGSDHAAVVVDLVSRAD
ncbi:MAG: endonuclease/exonuclease/phosphatase family protein [Acidimicrobiia bacterium]